MSSLSFFYTIKCCIDERRSKIIQNNVYTYAELSISLEPQRNLQTSCTNVHGMWRKS
jgi:hypothetical protein